jgi:hypothetical protein
MGEKAKNNFESILVLTSFQRKKNRGDLCTFLNITYSRWPGKEILRLPTHFVDVTPSSYVRKETPRLLMYFLKTSLLAVSRVTKCGEVPSLFVHFFHQSFVTVRLQLNGNRSSHTGLQTCG